jgi:hypothetical protein
MISLLLYNTSMKTNITMQSTKDRELFGVVIKQETQTGFMSLTDLQEAYTHARVLNGWANRGHIQDIIRQVENLERIYYILLKQGVIKSEIADFMKEAELIGITKLLKKHNAYKTTGRGDNKRVMCDPYIWVLVAMELNPSLYAEVVTWLTDKLILNRIEAGNMCKSLNSALYKAGNTDFSKIAIECNKVVFGRHETGIRNTGSKEELEKLYRLEDRIAFAIDRGYIKTTDEIIKAIRGE